MATYTELRNLQADPVLLGRTSTAIVIAASTVLGGTPTVDQTRYAAAVFTAPESEARKALMSVLAGNAAATVASIQAASDAALQANVDTAYPSLESAWIASNP